MVKAIPDGFTAITPSLVVKDADAAIKFYKEAFGAKETVCMRCPDTNKIMHAELEVNGAQFMLSGEWPEWKCFGPQHYKGTPVSMHLYVKDCDQVFDRAVKAGAAATCPVEDMFWGDRMGRVRDPFGHEWAIATHKEDLTPEQIHERGKKWMDEMKKKPVAA